MRVALVMGMSAGGTGHHVAALATGLAAAGHEVAVAAPPAALDRLALPPQGLRVLAVDIAERPRPIADAKAVGDLRALVAGADVVHAHGLRAGALAALAATGTATPLVVTLHNAAPEAPWAARVYAALERLVARRADCVLGVSPDLVDAMRDLGARRVALAVVPGPPPPAALTWAASVRRDLEVDEALAVVIARLAPQKGLDLLLDAVTLVRDLDVTVVVAGDGPLHDHLAARIDVEELPVRLLGRRTDVPSLLAAADVVVSSAVWEGQPIALQEALHVGAAIVATDVGGTRAVVGDGGRLVPGGDAPALADGIRVVLTDPDEAGRLRAAALDRAAHLPTEQDAVAAALSTYRAVRSS